MFVVKRNGQKEEVKFDKVTKRIKNLCKGLDRSVMDNAAGVAQKVCSGIVNMISTQDLDSLASKVAADMVVYHPDYGLLAGRLSASNLRKKIKCTFSEAMDRLYNNVDDKGNHHPVISKETYDIVKKHEESLNASIKYDRDLNYDIFGIETLKRSYLLRTNTSVETIMETPQFLNMRVAIGICGDDIEAILDMYDITSRRLYTHATPTLFNAGTPRPQMASCFLVAMKDDSIDGIFDTLKECANISKYSGGIGVHVNNIRSTGSHIKGTNGSSNGLIPFLKLFNDTAVAVDQGGGKRKGSFAIYVEPHHADIEAFFELGNNTGPEDFRARDLNLAVWINNTFFERVFSDGIWSLMDPNTCKGLENVYGDEYKALYEKYESEGKFTKQMKARDLLIQIFNTQIETGYPYIVNKDECNAKSNQKNLGVIKSSNLCSEIVEYSDADNTATCNLISVCLPRMFDADGEFDYELLTHVTRMGTRNLNKVIDRTWYPVDTAKRSNFANRPLGIGVTGLHDVFHQYKLSYDDPEAKEINRKIFETMYRAAILESIELAKEYGPYDNFKGSPASEGKFQFDLWGDFDYGSLTWDDWEDIRVEMVKHGLRNSLLIAIMPTGSTATIMGVTESIEIMTANIYSRKVLSGEFVVANKYMVKELNELGVWDDELAQRIMANKGSVDGIEGIPNDIKRRYRTVWEYKMKDFIDMSADRSPFVCQSQSLNMYMRRPTIPKMTSMIKYAYQKRLKTISYYFHSRAKADAMQFTIEKISSEEFLDHLRTTSDGEDDNDECLMCSA